MKHLTEYFTEVGMTPDVVLLLDGGIIVVAILLMIFSKTIIGIIEESPGLFGFGAFILLGLIPWLVLWAISEVVHSYRAKQDAPEILAKMKEDLERRQKANGYNDATKTEKKEEKKYI